MTVESRDRFTSIKRALPRIAGTVAVFYGMSQVGGDFPRPHDSETFSSHPSLSQMWSGEAPWLGWNRMQEAPMAVSHVPDFSASRPSAPETVRAVSRPVAIDWYSAIATGIPAGLGLWGAADVVRGVVARDRNRKIGGGIKLVLASQLACGIGPEIAQLTATPEKPAEIRFLDVSHQETQDALQSWLDLNATLPDGRVLKDVDGDGKIFAPIFDPPAQVISPDGLAVGSVTLAQVEAENAGKLEYQTFVVRNDGTRVAALATGNAEATADQTAIRSSLIDSSGAVIGHQETSTDLANPFIRLIFKQDLGGGVSQDVTYTLRIGNPKQIEEYLTFAKFTSGAVEVNVTPTAAAESTPTQLPSEMPTPTEAAEAFSLGSLELAPEQLEAMQRHAGLEQSITREADGRFTATVTVLNTAGQPETRTVDVTPSSLQENLDVAKANKYGNTPVMVAADGSKLYWIQEEKAWYGMELSADAAAPLFVPYEDRVAALRVTIAEFAQPFSDEAIARWKQQPGIMMLGSYQVINLNTGEDTKFENFANLSTNAEGLSEANSPVHILDTWFRTELPDGTEFTFFPTKWLDPRSGTNPQGNEWKILFCAVGDEIMQDELNRETYLKLLAQQYNSGQHNQLSPVFRAEEGFFSKTLPLFYMAVPQPSLDELMEVSGPLFGKLPNPGFDDMPYSVTDDWNFSQLGPDNPGQAAGIDKNDPKYHGFFPNDVQMIIFPSLVFLR